MYGCVISVFQFYLLHFNISTVLGDKSVVRIFLTSYPLQCFLYNISKYYNRVTVSTKNKT